MHAARDPGRSPTLPVVGKLLFGHNPLVYLSLAAVRGDPVVPLPHAAPASCCARSASRRSRRTRSAIRSCASATCAVLFGGACAGLGGAYLSVAYTPMWVEGMTAGRGWIALALVVFATWRPWRVLVGAYLFGGVTLAHVPGAGGRRRGAVAVPVDAALRRDHRRAGDHLARRDDDPAQRAGVAGPAVPRRRLSEREPFGAQRA